MSAPQTNGETPRTPRWVWSAILGLAAIQPALHLAIRYAPPVGMVPTGLYNRDSPVFFQSMRMFANGFYSPYASCASPVGDHHVGFYAHTLQWFYGVQGAVASALGADPFLFYGCFNGLAAAAFLFTVYGFLRTVVPRHAPRAFALYVFGGGLGGALYLVAGVLGLHEAHSFEPYFYRFAIYELLEGAHPFPISFYARSYYTIGLALCLGAFTAFVNALRGGCRKHLVFSTLPFLAGSFLNLRFALFTTGMLLLYLLCDREIPPRGKWRKSAVFLVAGAAGGTGCWLLMQTGALAVQNLVDAGNMNLWLSPFLSCMALFLLVAPGEAWHRAKAMTGLPRVLAFAGIGYLLAFAALFAAYQVYWGNILVARDGAVAARISDPALLGALLGIAYSFRRRPRAASPDPQAWIVLWMLGFLAIALSAWGQGWLLRFGPQRLVLFLHLPIAIVAALGIERLGAKRPRAATALTRSIVACGLMSIAVSSLYFQAPFGRVPQPQPFSWAHLEVMTESDARLIAELPPGKRVLATAPIADVIAYRRDNPVVFGTGTFNLSDVRHVTLQADVVRFFTGDTDAAWRRAFVEAYCVDLVYCSDTWPLDLAAIESLRATPWLRETAQDNYALVFEVVPE